MLKPGVSRRYAHAFYEVATRDGEVARLGGDLALVRSVMQANPEFVRWLESPLVPAAAKADLLANAFGSALDGRTLRLLKVLVEAGRGPYLRSVVDEFERMRDRDEGVLEARVESAVALTDREVGEIEDALAKGKAARAVRCHVEVRPELIAGLRVRLGDRVVDATVAGRLAAFRRSFSRQDIS